MSTSTAFNTSSQLSSMAHDLAGTSQDQTLSFTYNMAGQILTRSMTNALHAPTGLANLDHTFTVNGLDQYLTGAGVTFTHDARGGLTYDGTRTYAYDFDNRLTGVTGVGGAVALSYDPAGRLYQTAQTGGATIRFLYDGANLAAEYNGSNVLQKRYVHGPGLDNPVVAYTGSGTTSKVWLIADERGSVLAETNSSGAATQVNTYDEYGIPASGNSGRFGFTGQIWIAEIEAFHYRSRVYHPKLGRFLQTDPIGQAGGLNLYAYVGNDPVNWRDPWGLDRRRTMNVIIAWTSKPHKFERNDFMRELQNSAARAAINAVARALPNVADAVKEEAKEKAVETACKAPPIGFAGGVDMYAGAGATLQGGTSMDPKTGQVSIFGSVGTGLGGQLAAGAVPAAPLPYGGLMYNAPSGFGVNISQNVSASRVIGAGYSKNIVGTHPGETSFLFYKTTPGLSANANLAAQASIPVTPHFYEAGCNDDD